MIIKDKFDINNIKLLIYDVDGTLVEFRTLYSLIKDSFYKYGIQFKKEYFNEYIASVSTALNSDEKDFNFKKLSKSFVQNFSTLNKHKINSDDYLKLLLDLEYSYTYICKGVKSSLPILSKEYNQVISTNWFKTSQQMKLNKFKLLKYFEKIYTCENNYPKPNIKHFEKILRNYNLEPNNCVIIGDSISDVLPSKYGFNTILLDYYNTKENLYDYSNIVLEDFKEIPKILVRK